MARSPDYLNRLRGVLASEKPDIVLPGTDVELATLAANRSALESEFRTHVLVSSPAIIRIADDKWLTYQFLKELGFGFVPSCLPGNEQELIDEAGFPLVVKPRVGARSIGVTVVRTRMALDAAVAAIDDPVIQKHVGTSDSEYTAGTLTFDGTCGASIVMRRDLRDGNTFRAYSDAYIELNAHVQTLAERLEAYGPANFQFRLDDGVPRVFEINCRFSGTTPLRALVGFNEVEMAIRHVLFGEPVAQPQVRYSTILRHWSETVVEPAGLLRPTEQ